MSRRCCLGGNCTPWGPISLSHPGARAGTRVPWGMCSHPPPVPAGRYRTPSPQRTGTKQVAKKWCRCVMSNLCIIKILFEQMSQEVSGLLSQAGTAKFFWPSVAEQGVSALLAPAGIAAVVREPCLPVGTAGPGVLSSLVGTWLCSRWFCVHGKPAPSPSALLQPCPWLPGTPRAAVCVQQGAVGRPRRSWKGGGCLSWGAGGRAPWPPTCVGETGQAPACGPVLVGSPSPPPQPPEGTTASGVPGAGTPGQSRCPAVRGAVTGKVSLSCWSQTGSRGRGVELAAASRNLPAHATRSRSFCEGSLMPQRSVSVRLGAALCASCIQWD